MFSFTFPFKARNTQKKSVYNQWHTKKSRKKRNCTERKSNSVVQAIGLTGLFRWLCGDYFLFHSLSMNASLNGCALYVQQNIHNENMKKKKHSQMAWPQKSTAVIMSIFFGGNAGEWRMSAPVNKLDKDQMEWTHNNTNINKNN